MRCARFSTVRSRGVCSTFNPARRGVPNPQRRPKEKRPFESWGQIEAIAAQLGPVYGPLVIFGAATGLRPSELFGLEQHDIDREAGVVYVRRAFANGRIKNTKTRLSTRAVPLQAKAVEARPAAGLGQPDPVPERARRQDRLPRLRPPALATRTDRRRHRADPRSLRPAPHLRNLRAPRRRSGVRGLALHRLENRDDRPPLRPSSSRQPRARRRVA
jgi:integrase